MVRIDAPGTLDGGDVLRVGRRAFGNVEWIEVDPSERHAANALWVGAGVIYPRARVRTAALLSAHLEVRGMSLRLVDASELARAEGGVTCCSLILTNLQGSGSGPKPAPTD